MRKSKQSEAELEEQLIRKLSRIGYDRITIADDDLVPNLKQQLERLNDTSITEEEMKRILIHLSQGTVYEKAKKLRDRLQVTREDGETYYIQFFDSTDLSNNHYQVTHQISRKGTYRNRYDITLLINGLPLVQIELKRRGTEMKEAFHQICRYIRHSYGSAHGLFQYVQFYVISNGADTVYFANNKLDTLTPKQTFSWTDVDNNLINEVMDYAHDMLHPKRLGEYIANYIVFNETYKVLMAMRPYQYYATKAIIKAVGAVHRKHGYIWHTTGSGKTLTSFKASQIIMNMPEVDKVVFVVDRKDLDYQTMEEFNAFKKGSVDTTNNTGALVDQMIDDTKLVLTTIQKLNNTISPGRHLSKMEQIRDKRMVFIFDECHRSQFGGTHKRISGFFSDVQMFGFTGTPIFAENAQSNALGVRTTKDLFNKCLHKYLISTAIRDNNVLRWNIEYYGRYTSATHSLRDNKVIDIDSKEVLESDDHIQKIAKHVITHHDAKTHNRTYSAIMAISSIPMLIRYYDELARLKSEDKHDLRIAAIYTYGANEEDEQAQGLIVDDLDTSTNRAADTSLPYQSSHSREKLDAYIADYNEMYDTSHSTKDKDGFDTYFKDVSKRMKNREKVTFKDSDRLDIVLVVGMLLTGFDAKKINTLYVDKNMQFHGLIQAFSRVNRILDEKKSHGNILCYRNLKEAADTAIALYSDPDANETVVLPIYTELVQEFNQSTADLKAMAPTYKDIDLLISEDDQLEFVIVFRNMMRVMNKLITYLEFDWKDLDITEYDYNNYKSKYLTIRSRTTTGGPGGKESILDDIDFEVELIVRDEINVAYILRLLAKMKAESNNEKQEQEISRILSMIGSDPTLRSKQALIEKFIREMMPHIDDADDISSRFDQYWEDEKTMALSAICAKEGLDKAQFSALIEQYTYTDIPPQREDIITCLDNRPSVIAMHSIGERIMAKMMEYVEIFVRGMSA